MLSAVVYANGDVGVCELHTPLGNLRQKSFPEIWNSTEARELRESIARRECHCTTEVFLWSSIVYQPVSLARAMAGAKVWQKVIPLAPAEKVAIPASEVAAAQAPGRPGKKALPVVSQGF
jgi:hypothetical protein